MKSSATESLLIETPCRLEAVRDAARVLRNFLAANGAEEPELNDWELVTVEAGNNAVQYTPNGRSDRNVRFLMNVWPDSVELSITDNNRGFELPKVARLPEDDAEGGRGLFLMTALTDSVRYLRGKSENILVLRRLRPGARGVTHRRPITDVQRDADLETTLQLMTEELGASYESLSTIFRFSSELGRAGDSSRCTAKWLKELMKATQMEWFILRLHRETTGALDLLCSSSQPGLEPPVMLKAHAGSPRHLEVSAALYEREIWFDAETPVEQSEPLAGTFGRPICGVCYPIHVGGRLFGVLSMGQHAAKSDFSMSQMNVIHTFADFLGLQLSNDLAQQEAIKSRLVHRELEVAGDIQRSLLPKTLLTVPGFTLAGHSQSASAVGGDFYDVVAVGDDGALFAIADVMGKGVPAAMFAAMFRSHLRACAEMMKAPSRMLAWLNRALFADLDGVDMFVTAQLAYLHWPSRSLTVASAGHCPLLLADGSRNEVIEVSGDGPPLGIALDAVFRAQTVHLGKQARMLMITDGLIEARNPEGETLGQDPVTALLLQQTAAAADAAQIRDALLALAEDHKAGTAATDDLTLIVLAEESSH